MVATFSEVKGNQLGDMPDTSVYLDILFKGVGNSADGTDEQTCTGGGPGQTINGVQQPGSQPTCYTSTPSAHNQCKKQDGVISGKGPFCVDDEEQAALDITECYYVEGLKCIKKYADATQGAGSGGGAGGCCLMYQNALARSCDAREQEACANQGTATKDACDGLGGTAPGCGGTATKPLSAAEKTKCTEDYCKKAGDNERSRCMEAIFKPVAACYQSAKDDFDKCQKKIDNKCDCKNCIWKVVDPCADCPDPTTPTTPGTNTPVDPGDPFAINEFKTNSQFGIIPRVFGRYVTQGNVIWVGNKHDKSLTYTLDLSNGDSADVTDVVSTVDFIVALCLGPQQHLMRIWAGQQLVFNQTIDLSEGSTNSGIIDLDLSMLAGNGYSMARLKAFQPKIQFIKGTEAQSVLETYTVTEGFGLVPAHRGLTLVLISDVDLALIGNGFPDLKFDVMSTFAQDVLPNVISATQSSMATDYLEIDTRTEIAYLSRGAVTTLLNYNTFDSEYNVTTTGNTSEIITKSGHLVYYDGSSLRLRNPYKNRELVNYGAVGSVVVGTDTLIALDGTLNEYDAILLSAANGAVEVFAFDYEQDVGADLGISFPSVASATLYDSLVTGISNEQYLYQFFVSSATNAITIRKIQLSKNAVLTAAQPIQTFTVSPTLFGSVSDISGLRVMRDANDNSFVLFVKTTSHGSFIFKVNLAGVAVWGTGVATGISLPAWSRVGEIRSRLATDFYFFIDASGNIMSLSSADGSTSVIDSLSARSLPAMGGVQYYEGANTSIIYQTGDSRLVRIWLKKIVPTKVTFADVMRSLIKETRFDPTLLDLTDVEDISFDGFYIDSSTTIQDVVGTLGALYLVSFSDDGRALRLLKDTSLISSPVVMDYYVKNTLNTSRAVTTEYLDSASCNFHNITDLGLIDLKQTVTIKPDLEQTEVPTFQDISLNLNETPENIRVALERILQNEISNRDTIAIGFFPRDIAFTPRDAIIWDGTIYRITTSITDATDEVRLTGVRYDKQTLTDDADLLPNPLDNARIIRRPTRKPPYRPVVLFTNAINDEDVIAAQPGNNQVVYTGFEAPTQSIIPTRFKFRMLATSAPLLLSHQGTVVPLFDPISGKPKINANGAITLEVDALDNGSSYYATQTHTKALHSGIVVTPPNQVGPDFGNGSIPQFKPDLNQSFVVKFDFADTITKFVSGLVKYAVLELPTTNMLIVGREYIQFDTWTVGMDGLTVTFTRLYRGKQGTEPYINTHFTGEKVYLYTADTFKTTVIDAQWTKKQQLCSMVLGQASIAGVTDLGWTKRSDAGSARSWPPVGVKMRDVNEDGTGNYIIRVRHRSPFRTDFNLSGGGRMQNDTGNYTVMGFRAETPDLEEFEQRIIRNFDEAAAEADFIFKVDILGYDPDHQDPDPLVASSFFASDVFFDVALSTFPERAYPKYVAIMSLRNNVILGHPTFRRLPRGGYPVGKFRP